MMRKMFCFRFPVFHVPHFFSVFSLCSGHLEPWPLWNNCAVDGREKNIMGQREEEEEMREEEEEEGGGGVGRNEKEVRKRRCERWKDRESEGERS